MRTILKQSTPRQRDGARFVLVQDANSSGSEFGFGIQLPNGMLSGMNWDCTTLSLAEGAFRSLCEENGVEVEECLF